MRRKKISRIAIVLLLSTLFAPYLFVPSASAGDTVTVNIDFGGTKIDGVSYLPTNSVSGKTVSFEQGKEVESWEVFANGKSLGQVGSLSGNTLTLPTITGQGKTVAMFSNKNPGHAIWRNAAGTTWQTTGEKVGTYYVTGDCVTGGVSECPGTFPSSLPEDLEYNGKAVTTAYKVAPPNTFKIDPNNVEDQTVPTIPSTSIDPLSVKVVPGKSVPITRGVSIIGGGKGDVVDGVQYGMIRVAKSLTADYNVERTDYTLISPGGTVSGHTQGRNYAMIAKVYFEAVSYTYSGYVQVKYKEPVDPCVANPSAPGCQPTPTPSEPPTYTVTGDFDILPSSTINWRDSFQLKPKNFVIPSECKYLHHEYRFEKDGYIWYSDKINNQTAITSFSYSTYPSILGIGSNYIEIRVTADCANSGWSAKKILYIDSPSDNHPPQFSAGFFKEYNRTGITPEYEVVVNSSLNLRIINDTTKNPSLPYDPDGDPIEYTWLFSESSSPWIQSFESEYGFWDNDDAFFNIKATELGYHSVKVIARDPFGAESSRTVSINVIPENPIPLIDGPTEVKENRPLPTPISGSRSYSPAGNQIVDYIWENKKDVYTTPGTETIKLDVVDNKGLKSLSPAVHTLTVLPDEPPYIAIDAPPLAIRNTPVTVTVDYGSPDGDTVANVQIYGYYDANNNGTKDASEDFLFDFTGLAANESITKTAGGSQLTFKKLTDTTFQVSASKVGKVYFEGQATEDYGKKGYTTAAEYVDVTNQAPSVSFVVEGKNDQPTLNPTTTYNPGTILKNWALYKTNSLAVLPKAPYSWSANGNLLESGTGVGNLYQDWITQGYSYHSKKYVPPVADFGFGPNSISPYKGIEVRTKSQPILLPRYIPRNYNQYVVDLKNLGSVLTDLDEWERRSQAGEYLYNPNILRPVEAYSMIRSNPTHIYFDTGSAYGGSDQAIYALNKSRIPNYSFKYKTIMSPSCCSFNMYGWHRWEGNVSPYDFMIYMPYERTFTTNIPFYSLQDQNKNPRRWDPGQGKLIGWEYEAQSGNFSGASSTKDMPVKAGLFAKEVTGKTIYEIRSSRDVQYGYAYIDSDDDYYEYTGGSGDYRMYYILTYDAVTGAEIVQERIRVRTKLDPKVQVKGDNIVLIFSDQNWDAPATKLTVLEINRNGEVVVEKEIPIHLEMTVKGPGYVIKDDKGNFYLTFTGGQDPWYKLYVVQLKSDYTIGISAKVLGDNWYNIKTMPEDNFYEPSVVMAINNATNQLYVRAFNQGSWSNQRSPVTSVVDLNTGVVYNWGRHVAQYYGTTKPGFTPFYMDPYGNVINGVWATYTATGHVERPNWHDGREVYFYANSAGSNRTRLQAMGYGVLVGDGMYISTYNGSYDTYAGPAAYMMLDIGTPRSGPSGLKIGQLQSPNSLADAEIQFTMNMYLAKNDSNLAGFSFRMADPTNRYAVETDGTTLYLSKYTNGVRSILASSAFPFVNDTNYTFKVHMQGSALNVSLDGVPYFSVSDSSFASGKFGPFTDKPLVSFSNISTKLVTPPNVEWLNSYAIWENGSAQAEVRYSDMVFEDPENDPRAGNNQWSIQHTPKFLNNQGLSALNGKTLSSPALKLDKVGNYRITLKAQDDPHPNYLYPSSVFAGYRKWSNEYWRIVTVHRRPVAQFTLSINPTDHTVVWNDQSYDPDRWQSPTVYDTENTGINYGTTRGVLERRYYYETPSGAMVNSKLVAPSEVGTYRVGLQVKDEYGAWSYWAEQTIKISVPVIDEPPIPGFNLSKTTLYRGEPLTITSTARDKEDGPAANLWHEYYIRNVTEGTAETLQSTNRSAWDKVFNSIGVMEIRQVVYDSKGQSAQLVKQVTVLNRAPAANFDWSPKPVYEGDDIAIANLSSDPDGDALTYVWTVHGPNGYKQSGSTKDMAIDGSQTLQHPGIYRVTLRVRDAAGAETSVSRDIAVRELTIEGFVLHTEDWEENRQRYNAKYPQSARPADWFWAGEAFRLAAVVTDTGISATKPVSVEAEAAPALRKALARTGPDLVRWEGLLRSEDAGFPLDELPEGPYTFVFTVRYSNGAVKTSTVTIQIKNTVQQYVQVHRIQ